jgi:hypothetical protein
VGVFEERIFSGPDQPGNKRHGDDYGQGQHERRDSHMDYADTPATSTPEDRYARTD